MSYHFNITRSARHTFGPLSLEELKEKVQDVHGYRGFIDRSDSTEFRFSPEDLAGISIFWKNGDLWAERATEDQIPFLSAVALALHARLLGDEGEEYKADGRIIPGPQKGRPGFLGRVFGRRKNSLKQD